MNSVTRWNRKFYASTRGRIVGLLRRAALTVDQIARDLHLTDNAVRAHLAALERDGLVEQHEPRRGSVGKPANTYRVTEETNQLLSRAYVVVFARLLDVLSERMSAAELDSIMRTVGQRLAAENARPSGSHRDRVERAATILDELGGATSVEEHDGMLRIRGHGCPLGTVVRSHPEVCGSVEALLSEAVGSPVRECCDHGERPQCCFEVAAQEAG
ncbi:MAG TPA: ArsR family transcriptional regulator [Gemmatimonadaceae bacterium]|nr:ArsR family transcriptional regulator [Gemmatimonadaceae bacterium]